MAAERRTSRRPAATYQRPRVDMETTCQDAVTLMHCLRLRARIQSVVPTTRVNLAERIDEWVRWGA